MKWFRTGAALWLSAIGFLGLPTGASQASELMERATAEGIRIGFFNFKPYAFTDENNNLVGTDVEILRHILPKMGATISAATAVEWSALIPGLKAGRFDVVAAGMFVTPARCAEVQFTEPVFGIGQTLVVPKESDLLSVANYEQVAEMGLSVAAITGTGSVGYLRAAGVPEDRIMQLPDSPSAIASVRAKRTQAFAISVPGAREIVRSVPEKDMAMTTVFSEVAGELAMPHGAFAFRPADKDFVDALNAQLAAFIGTPEHIKILESYGMEKNELPIRTTSELCKG